MNKEEFVKSLTKVKLVIGNGFDLHCGLHTRYYDYYCKKIQIFSFIKELYKSYEKTNTINIDDEKIKDISTWSVFFALNSFRYTYTNERFWCDIERLMLSSFMTRPISTDKFSDEWITYLASDIHWEEIKIHISRNELSVNNIEKFMVDFVKHKMNFKNIYPNNFYNFLLNELKEFECDFGVFMYNQLHDTYLELCNYGKEFLHEPYLNMSKDTIKDLCNENNLVAIDSFNYGNVIYQKVASKLQNINGDYTAPIFGVDSLFEPKDERFIFTKTGRRIDSDMFGFAYEKKPDFDNVIIFGHSLDEADYGYFFPLFDRLNLTDSLATNVVVFAYSIYDNEKGELIKSQLRDSISRLLYAYAVDKKLSNPNRFLDSLSTQKRIVTYQIPTLDTNKYGNRQVEKEWEEIYKKAESYKNN